MSKSQLLHAIGSPIAFHPGLVPVLGSVNAVLFFGQIFYWQDNTDCPFGVYKSSEEIQQETGLTYREQANAREKLRDCRIYHSVRHEPANGTTQSGFFLSSP